MRLALACLGELVGTYILVGIGTASVAVAVLTDVGLGAWGVAAIWGGGLAIAIYLVNSRSGAHLNPAVTLAFALFRRYGFSRAKVPLDWAAQLLGAGLAGLTVLWLFGGRLRSFEAAQGLVRGQPSSELSGMVFGQYFPNPAVFGAGPVSHALVSPAGAAVVEGFGTAVLAFVVLAVADRRDALPRPRLVNPLLIAITLTLLIGVFAPLTQGGWNPARDFGPRLVAYLAGWGEMAIPGPGSGFWVYIVGPFVGAPIGGAAYELLRRAWAPKRRRPAEAPAGPALTSSGEALR